MSGFLPLPKGERAKSQRALSFTPHFLSREQREKLTSRKARGKREISLPCGARRPPVTNLLDPPTDTAALAATNTWTPWGKETFPQRFFRYVCHLSYLPLALRKRGSESNSIFSPPSFFPRVSVTFSVCGQRKKWTKIEMRKRPKSRRSGIFDRDAVVDQKPRGNF